MTHLDLNNHLIDLRLELPQVFDVQHAEHCGRGIQLLICRTFLMLCATHEVSGSGAHYDNLCSRCWGHTKPREHEQWQANTE